MIQGFEVKDFKCHVDYNEIKIPGLTVISGTNNSGKSSLLQAIYLLTQNKTNSHTTLLLNEELELGSFADILHKSKSSTEPISFAVDFSKEVLQSSGLKYLTITFSYQSSAVFEHLFVGYGDGNPVLSGMEFQLKKNGQQLQTVHLDIVDAKDSIFYRVTGDIDNGYCKMQGIVPDSVIYRDLAKTGRAICSPEFEIARDYLSRLSRENIKYRSIICLSPFFSLRNGKSLLSLSTIAMEKLLPILLLSMTTGLFPVAMTKSFSWPKLTGRWIPTMFPWSSKCICIVKK
ncbi:MAG: ATP-binding protein [Acidobacteria bacterium]|jgi:hypothetical protein|nr:ATP-binding protein [Acidobacteriota bacterium]